jgi:hypothetical protein
VAASVRRPLLYFNTSFRMRKGRRVVFAQDTAQEAVSDPKIGYSGTQKWVEPPMHTGRGSLRLTCTVARPVSGHRGAGTEYCQGEAK